MKSRKEASQSLIKSFGTKIKTGRIFSKDLPCKSDDTWFQDTAAISGLLYSSVEGKLSSWALGEEFTYTPFVQARSFMQKPSDHVCSNDRPGVYYLAT